ncbi:conserved hypothetical protein [Coccidioides posadasii str. Silveira]|uniref:Uncharacterized protein n=1 Tax=Coccidioides posadasii (strain RMSCC 757 / Silveira) TaxID=443226 RepID=E9DGZ4_COCPS|nr:conserved hypothetical protein [Coccidioides posadasii str. Silveira]
MTKDQEIKKLKSELTMAEGTTGSYATMSQSENKRIVVHSHISMPSPGTVLCSALCDWEPSWILWDLESIKKLKESNNRLEVVINNSIVLQLSKQSCSDDKGFLYRYIRVRARLSCLLKSSRIRYNYTVSQDFSSMKSNQDIKVSDSKISVR